MYNIELTINNKEVFVSSRIIAERFGKRTDNVNKKIREIMEIEDLDTALKNEGIEVDDMRLVFGTYSDNSGKTNVEYLCNEALFNELVGSFTGKEARKYRVEFREQFKLMREQLQRIANGEGDFVDTLKLTRHSVEKYLPQFLNYKNVDVVLPKLVDRCISELDKGTIKIDILTSAIRVARTVRDQLDGVAEREIMNKYIEKASMKKEHILASRIGGIAKHKAELEDKCKRLQEGAYEEQEFFDYLNTLAEDKSVQIYKQNMNMFVAYISQATGKTHREVYRAIYSNVIDRYCNLYLPTAKSVKEAGYKSLVEYFYVTQGIGLLNEFASEAESWAKKLNFGNINNE